MKDGGYLLMEKQGGTMSGGGHDLSEFDEGCRSWTRVVQGLSKQLT